MTSYSNVSATPRQFFVFLIALFFAALVYTTQTSDVIGGGFLSTDSPYESILGATFGGIPISTTHAITGAILGVGTTHGVRSVRWIWGQRIVIAWILTIPCTAFIAAVAYELIHLVIEPLMK